jgi:hypothetical protein
MIPESPTQLHSIFLTLVFEESQVMPVIKVQQLLSEDFKSSGISPPIRAHERITKQHWWEFDLQEGGCLSPLADFLIDFLALQCLFLPLLLFSLESMHFPFAACLAPTKSPAMESKVIKRKKDFILFYF